MAKVAFVVLLAVYALLTVHRIRVWDDNVSLWQDAVETAPCLDRPHVQLALAYQAEGRTMEAQIEWATVAQIAIDHRCPVSLP